jgi:hypothetical protein
MAAMREQAGFQERGGPRSLSDGPIDETMISESNADEILAARCNGAEGWVARNARN